MPDFYVDDIEISPSDFVDASSDREILELIEILKEDGYLSDFTLNTSESNTVDDEMFLEDLQKLSTSRHRLTKEEEEIIKTIANRL